VQVCSRASERGQVTIALLTWLLLFLLRASAVAVLLFLQGLSDLASLVFECAAPKTFRGVTLTGPLLVSMLRGAVEAANKPGGVLNIGSMWSSMLEAELARAAAAARTAYDKAASELAACSSAEQADNMHQVSQIL
jgi:hypothetical protein